MPLVKWETKLEDMYDEIRSKNPYDEYTHLAPNVILLDKLRDSDELSKHQSFLDELNNISRFREYTYFESPLLTDYMGMANKIHMKELIIKIWFRIKK